MQGRRALKPAPVELVRASLAVDDRGALVWPLLAPRANPHRGRKAGSLRPDGSTVVSIRRDGVLWTLRAERAAWCVHYGELPVAKGDNPDWPRTIFAAKISTRGRGRPVLSGSGAAMRLRERALKTLERLAAHPGTTVAAIAQATGVDSSNVSRRLRRLGADGLVKPVCVPGRAHWLLTKAGRAEAERALEVELLTPHDLNGHRTPWFAALHVW